MTIQRLLPERVYLGQQCNFCLQHVDIDGGSDFGGEGERLLRFVLPPFQRPPVWSEKQKVKFMESLILGLPVGSYTYHSAFGKPTDGWLIDGQQRMIAIRDYLDERFPVFGHYWTELTNADRRRVMNMQFPAYVLKGLDEEELLQRYIALNYNGTPHTAKDEAKAKRRLRKLNKEGGTV